MQSRWTVISLFRNVTETSQIGQWQQQPQKLIHWGGGKKSWQAGLILETLLKEKEDGREKKQKREFKHVKKKNPTHPDLIYLGSVNTKQRTTPEV